MIGAVLANKRYQANASKSQENKASYLQPELMRDPAEVMQGGSGSAQQGAVGAAALHLLSSNPGSDA